ncbi:hypothetical protein D777_00907 [Marinobacter nitratireducens]|uniref:Uncharacterized protein n=1 Tax=Marinobacter nitratireducens TaxID=1137280 RepID=A0A072N5N6_9GAMM|nr:hypothetical protein D777_00907 [Marinobacter nitratireducens]
MLGFVIGDSTYFRLPVIVRKLRQSIGNATCVKTENPA